LSLIADPDTYLVLEDLKREGKIRFYGVSVHPPEEGLAAVEVTRPDTVQIVYNLVRREAEDRFFVVARASNVGVIAREPLANGLLAGKYGRDSTWDKGDIRARMPRPYVVQLTEVAGTVGDFAELANSGFYDGTKFHRVIPNFMIQGGDPISKTGKGRVGTGGPGYTIKCETQKNVHKHVAGTLSMAHAGKDTGGSQFFICHSPQPHLDGVHTVFGQVAKGQ